MTNAALRGKPDAGNPHVRFDGGEVAPAATPRRGSLLYNEIEKLRNDARAVIAGYTAGDDFDAVVSRLAAIGYALEDALTRV